MSTPDIHVKVRS